MFRRSSQLGLPVRRCSARRAFSFVEILFAIAVLGIGFIMLAAIFPVGLQQTKLTLDETAAAASARGSVANLSRAGEAVSQYSTAATLIPWPPAVGTYQPTSLYPASYLNRSGAAIVAGSYPGIVRTFNDPRSFPDLDKKPSPPINYYAGTINMAPAEVTALAPTASNRRYYMWHKFSSDTLSAVNDRNGQALLYRRDVIASQTPAGVVPVAASSAQVFTIYAQVANQSAYSSVDVTAGPGVACALYNLEPRPVAMKVLPDADGVYYVKFFSVTALQDTTPTGPYDRGGYPSGASASGPTWDQILTAAPFAVAEGTFFVVSDDRITQAGMAGRFNGRIFRTGNPRPDLSDADGPAFEFAPGYEFKPDPGPSGQFNDAANDDVVYLGAKYTGTQPVTIGGKAYRSVVSVAGTATNAGQGVVGLALGRGFSVPGVVPPGITANPGSYVGPAMDVSIYTTFVSVTQP